MFLLAAAIAFSSLSTGAQGILRDAGIDEKAFPGYIHSIDMETAVRETQGENEHLIFFVLQSSAFTALPSIEPALSAAAFMHEKTIPASAARRFAAFLRARPSGERMTYLRSLLPHNNAREFLKAQYQRTMISLYEKEFQQSTGFYQTRGHSTDTNIAANYAVWNGLRVLQATNPGLQINRVLIVGPGLDFAPRTGLQEKYPPQSYQPFAIADALLGLGLSRRPVIECMDINTRVLEYFRDLSVRKNPEVHVISAPGTDAYLSFFRNLGNGIGIVHEETPLERSISVRPEVARAISAFQGNIITETPAGRYDLVVATNVLVYCKDLEVLLALNNISITLTSGGYFILNEIRPVIDTYATLMHLTPVQARTILISQGTSAPLYDAFAIYQKLPSALDIPSNKK